MQTLNTTKAIEAIEKITKEEVDSYNKYWGNLKPETYEEKYWRYIFAFLSVHTTWSANVNSFLLLRTHNWRDDRNELLQLLIESRGGCHTIKCKGIEKFTKEYWRDPETWLKQKNESYIACRDRIMEKCYGLGPAKTAFTLEMLYPLENTSVCLDTHMIQLYGLKNKDMTPSIYKKMEKHWSDTCSTKGMSPYIGRCIFWDKKQNKVDSSYWSHVFEKDYDKEGNFSRQELQVYNC